MTEKNKDGKAVGATIQSNATAAIHKLVCAQSTNTCHDFGVCVFHPVAAKNKS